MIKGFRLNSVVSGWQDSNLRPPAPKAGAIPGYATPRTGIGFKKNPQVHLQDLSGWQDSNLRPPAPKAGAIPGYATPRTWYLFTLLQGLAK